MNYSLTRTLIYFLIFSVVSSFLAYKIISRAYDNAYASDNFEVQILKAGKTPSHTAK
ncbi:MAG TPA: hypothetical protein VG694_01780 [Candidatus Paceibacterota bacterium]|nr:hypothetical protein [Candidatus Paceibacterota bacterium]